jgi:hypothetical protein
LTSRKHPVSFASALDFWHHALLCSAAAHLADQLKAFSL